jgi:hypothetical protein
MIKKLKNSLLLCALILLSIITSSCRKELYYGEESGGHMVKVKVAWPTDVATPEGVRAIFYPSDGGTPRVYNISPTGEDIYVPSGTYTVVLFNNDTEYVKLYNSDKTATLEARTLVVQKSGIMKSFPSQDIVNMPEMFYSYKIDKFQVTDGDTPDVLDASPLAKVKTFKIRVKIGGTGGIKYVSSGTGFLSGVCGSYFPATDLYPTASSAIYFDFSEKGTDYIDATVRTFGINATGTSPQESFRLLLTLINGKVITYDCDLTSQLKVDLNANVIIIIPATVDVPEIYSGSGFDAHVKDWDNTDSDIPL